MLDDFRDSKNGTPTTRSRKAPTGVGGSRHWDDNLHGLVMDHALLTHHTNSVHLHDSLYPEDPWECLSERDLEDVALNASYPGSFNVWNLGWTVGHTFRTARAIWHGGRVNVESAGMAPKWSPDSSKIAFGALTHKDGQPVTTWSILHVQNGFVQDVLHEPVSTVHTSHFHSCVRWTDDSELSFVTGHRHHPLDYPQDRQLREFIAGERTDSSSLKKRFASSKRNLVGTSNLDDSDDDSDDAFGDYDERIAEATLRHCVIDDDAKTAKITGFSLFGTHGIKGGADAIFDELRHSCTCFSPDGTQLAMLFGFCDLKEGQQKTKAFVKKHNRALQHVVVGKISSGGFQLQHSIPIQEALYAHTVDWSPDGKMVAVGIGGGMNACKIFDVSQAQYEMVQALPHPHAQEWDTKLGKRVSKSMWDDVGVSVVCFSPPSSDYSGRLATGCNGIVRIYDTKSWVIHQEFNLDIFGATKDHLPLPNVSSISWHPLAHTVAIGTDTQGVQVVLSGALQAQYPFNNAKTSWSPCGLLFSCWNNEGHLAVFRHGRRCGGVARTVEINDIAHTSERVMRKLAKTGFHDKHETHETWSPDRRHCCMVRQWGTILIVSLDTGRLEYNEPIPEVMHCTHIVWSPDCDTVAVGYQNSHVYFLRRSDASRSSIVGKNDFSESVPQTYHWRRVNIDFGDLPPMDFAASHTQELLSFNDPHCLNWDPPGTAAIARFSDSDGKDRYLRVEEDGTVSVEYPGYANYWSPDGSKVVCWNPEVPGEISILDSRTAQVVRKMTISGEQVVSFEWGPDNRGGVVCTERAAKIMMLENDPSVDWELPFHSNDAYYMTWNPCFDYIAIFDSTGVYCIDFQNSKLLWHQEGYHHPQYGPGWSPSGQRLMGFDSENRPVALTQDTGETCETWRFPKDVTFETDKWTPVQSWEWNADGRTALALEASSGKALIIDGLNGMVRKNLFALYPGGRENCQYGAVVWSRDGMKVQMADLEEPEPLCLAVFDWCLCDNSKIITEYGVSHFIATLCLGEDLERGARKLQEELTWATARLPRFGLHMVFLLTLKGDAERLRLFAQYVPSIKKMFAVPVAVLPTGTQAEKDHLENRLGPSQAGSYYYGGGAQTAEFKTMMHELVHEGGGEKGCHRENDLSFDGVSIEMVDVKSEKSIIKDPLNAVVSAKNVAAKRAASAHERLHALYKGKRARMVNQWQARQNVVEIPPTQALPDGMGWVWKYPIDIAMEHRKDDVVEVLVEWMNEERG